MLDIYFRRIYCLCLNLLQHVSLTIPEGALMFRKQESPKSILELKDTMLPDFQDINTSPLSHF